ncbi:hypothetical protein [uncultured Duncaniella sp.]|uniref:hypothetical protein n=1 Tax=uncultured Duncaniella sp. TaxID=2768039 RepID=UPI00267749C4|nr:hypothetical protein [uncultured Duncaniella sp.]
MDIIVLGGLVSAISIIFIVRYVISNKNDDNSTIVLPKYCMIEYDHPSALIKCLDKMVSLNCTDINLDLCNVEEFPYETHLVICAQAEKAKDQGRRIFMFTSGSLSLNVAQTLMLKKNGIRTHHQHVIGKESTFIQHSQITPELVSNVEKELKRIGIRDYYDLNTLVTEIIGNAIEHGIRDQNINWWMHHYVERGTLKMVFVDMGTGIATSYRKAGIGKLTSDGKLLKRALNGDIGSSTKKPNRGKGLPQMDLMVRNNFISNFILITNKVTLRYNKGEYVSIRHSNFVGTYYSWTITKENFLKWQTWSTSQKTIAES